MMRDFLRELAGPLDRQTKTRPQDRRGQHADKGGGHHPGLLLQRYLYFERTDGEEVKPKEKRAVLQAAIHAAANAEVRTLYQAAFDRWSASLSNDAVTVDLATVGQLIVGLGSENVLETGIRLHHTYGMPILPGSALKGLAAHYCNQVWGQATDDPQANNQRYRKPTPAEDEAYRKFLAEKGPEPDANYHRLLFGNTDDNGCITFHDAWFVPESEKEPLKLDVMTPHHPNWLDGSEPPTDFDSPIPVAFVSVAGTFRVTVSWHGPEHTNAPKWTKRAMELLCDALCGPEEVKNGRIVRNTALAWGVGGKTTSGYGRLVDLRHEPSPRNAADGPVKTPPKPTSLQGSVRVRFLGPHDALKTPQQAYWVQEAGKKRGLMKYGRIPAQLPGVDSEIEVYRNNNDSNAPEYRWDPPPTPRKGGPGGGPPRGRR